MPPLRYLASVVSLQMEPDKCTGCGLCTVVCPHGVFGLEEGRARLQDRDACMECGACAQNCPAGAIAVKPGVGCAMAVINATLGKDPESCCCLADLSEPGS